MLFVLNISLGSVDIPLKSVFKSLIGGDSGKETWNYIIINYRLPKAITAVLVGSGLAVGGLLMQTLFRNPLAGPYVLGISSGASLGVALLILGSSIIGGSFHFLAQSQLFISLAASAGSFLVLFAVMIVSKQVKNTMSILIIGLMFSSLTSAVISVLAYFSSAENLQQYMFWGFGSLGNLTWSEVLIFACIYLIAGILILISVILAWIHSPYWLIITFIVGINEIMFSLFGICVTSNILYILGAKPRLQK